MCSTLTAVCLIAYVTILGMVGMTVAAALSLPRLWSRLWSRQ